MDKPEISCDLWFQFGSILVAVGPGGTEKSAVRHLSAQLGAFDDELSKVAQEEKTSIFHACFLAFAGVDLLLMNDHRMIIE